MDKENRYKEGQQIADAAIENYGSITETMIILDIASAICRAILDERYYAKHPDERPLQ